MQVMQNYKSKSNSGSEPRIVFHIGFLKVQEMSFIAATFYKYSNENKLIPSYNLIEKSLKWP